MGSIIGPPPSTRRGQRGTPTWSACWRPPAQPPTSRIMPPPRQPPTPPRRGARGPAPTAGCDRPARMPHVPNHVLHPQTVLCRSRLLPLILIEAYSSLRTPTDPSSDGLAIWVWTASGDGSRCSAWTRARHTRSVPACRLAVRCPD